MNAEAIYLQAKLKSTGKAYLFYILFGCHYLYMGKVGIQILFWITGGGFLIWLVIDLFRIPTIVENHNKQILEKLKVLEEKEKTDRRNEMIAISNMHKGA